MNKPAEITASATASAMAPPLPELDAETNARRAWMSVLATCEPAALEAHMQAWGPLPSYTLLRPPEPGAAMVRARVGGDGEPFHLGEMTLTRCAVQLPDGTVGHAYVQGRNRHHAEVAAVLDALLQDHEHRPELMEAVIEPLANERSARTAARSRRAATTAVEFFTVVRGEDGP